MRGVAASFFVLSILLGTGCEPSLGECDMLEARALTYDALGKPYYKGQALMVASCGGTGGFCHTNAAVGTARHGVPFGFNFDMDLVPRNLTLERDVAATDVLRAGQARTYEEREDIYGAVLDGDMPALPEFYEHADNFVDADSHVLPRLNTAEGQDILRNWLACGSPVVERRPTLDTEGHFVFERPAGVTPVGDIVAPNQSVLTPEFSSIYSTVIATTCGVAGCHQGTEPTGNLDMGSLSVAYTNLVNVAAASPGCNMSGATRVVPEDSDNSLLINKLEGHFANGDAVCGPQMPFGGTPLDQTVIDVIREWIDSGAQNN